MSHSYSKFDEYIRQGDPDKSIRAANWSTSIGLQDVDGLKTSDYLRNVALRNIEGEIDSEESKKLIDSYYNSRPSLSGQGETREADKAAANINEILSRRTLDFTVDGFAAVHRQIFTGIFKHAGKFRDFDITKREWVLRGDTVSYLNHHDLRRAVEFDLLQEKEFSYSGLSPLQMVEHLASFIANLWQIHPFSEGNTRASAVFLIQYLRSIGFEIDNAPFAKHSWYFRNALVRANYKNALSGVDYEPEFLVRFLSNTLLGTDYELKNRFMLINPPADLDPAKQGTSREQVGNKQGTSREQAQDMQETGVDFSDISPDIVSLLMKIGESELTAKQLMDLAGLSSRRNFTSKYLAPALEKGLILRRYPDKPKHPKQAYRLSSPAAALVAANRHGKQG